MKKVAIVGVEGSGKTVMLAGLGELYARPDTNGYFLAPKNFQTASYVAEKIARMRKGEWPVATAEDVLQGLDWTLRRRQGKRQRPTDVCEVSCLDFAGEVYRAAYGISSGANASLTEQAEALKQYVRGADDLIVLINMRDVIANGLRDQRVQEAMWITKSILDTALGEEAGRKAPRAAIVLSQADSYADTIRACGGPRGVLAKYLPHVANNYDWLDILAVSAVDKTVLDDGGNMVPAADFTPCELRPIMDWILKGLGISVPTSVPLSQPPPVAQKGPRLGTAAKVILGAVAALGLVAIGAWWTVSGRDEPTETKRSVTKSLFFQQAPREAGKSERRTRCPKEGEEFTINEPYGLDMTMKWCPAGSFMMGSPSTEDGRYDDEEQHQVTFMKGFWMGETEVTQGQWKKIMGGETVADLARKGLQDDEEYMINGKKQTLREYWGLSRDDDPMKRCGDLNDDVPVYNVSWYEAVEFCRRLTRQERAAGRLPAGYEYRLPTEAEWEYACRAGTTTALPNGRDIRILGQNNAPALDDIAWYGGNSSRGFEGRGVDTSDWSEKQYPGGLAFAREVKDKAANRWGLYDMIGNVCEWCGDTYGSYPEESVTDPYNNVPGGYRVLRGGGWNYLARRCRSADRFRLVPGRRDYDFGFRLCCSALPIAAASQFASLSRYGPRGEAEPGGRMAETPPTRSVRRPARAEGADDDAAEEMKCGEVKTLTLPGGATMEMIYVAPGSFTMGSPSSEDGRYDREAQHRVTLTKGYWLGKYEVTQRQWESVMGTNPSYFKGPDRPVENVSWDDCQRFIAKVDAEACRQFGGGARLPTEAEWEYACRAGTTTAFSWGNALNGDKANCDGNYPCGTTVKGRYREETADVGSYSPNAWGFYDMHGNVWEWCSDWYGSYDGDATDPIGPSSGGSRVSRGGDWVSDARDCRSAYRSGSFPGHRDDVFGFRLCCSALP